MAREIRARSILDRITAWSPVLLLGSRLVKEKLLDAVGLEGTKRLPDTDVCG